MKRADSNFQPKILGFVLALVWLFAGRTHLSAQCTLACNNLVQISLDQDCSVAVTAPMVLQPSSSCPNGQFSVIIYPLNSQVPIPGSPVVNASHIGQTLVAKVIDGVSGNTCWSNILIEDKLPPQLTCPPIHVYCNWPDWSPQYLQAYGVAGAYPAVVENCSTYTLTFSDEQGDVDCNGSINGVTNISAWVKRTWVATDASGNHSTCMQWIYFDRKQASDIDWPNDVTFECTDADTDPAHTGIPTIDYVPLWPDQGFCELNVNYTDQFFDICDGSFKILRTWTAYDWCKPTSPTNPVYKIQVIKFLDTHGPVFTCPSDKTISTNSYDCQKDYDLPDVVVTDACSSIKSAKATYVLPNWQTVTVYGTIQLQQVGNPWVLQQVAVFGDAVGLPVGMTTVTYTITDDCGNQSVCSFKVTVADLIPPVAVCREITQIGLGVDGMALPPASTFNEGSYDNCSPVYFKVRRMDANNCQNVDYFHDKVKFCCEDRGDTVMVILRVYDLNPGLGDVSYTAYEGHFNDCMIEVYVEDKLKPVCQAPNDVTTTCEAFDPSLWAYGKASATDNCCMDTITESVDYSQFDKACKRGTIRRTFTAKDCAGLTSRCTQYVKVDYINDYQIKWPDDVELTNCNGSSDYGSPIIYNENCELIAVNKDDKIFTLVPDACYKILRTWTVLNWCTYNPNEDLYFVTNPQNTTVGPTISANGYNGFSYVQIIKIHDTVDPYFIDCPTATVEFCDYTKNDPTLYNHIDNWDPVHKSHDLCEGPADLKVQASDDCSAANLSIRYTIFADLNGDGAQETIINSANNSLGFGVTTSVAGTALWGQVSVNGSVNFELPYGLHKIKWFISDGCGNENTCEYHFQIKDCKKPTAVCLNGLSVNIMNTNPAMIELWDTDFLNYGEDNCTPADQLKYGIRKKGTGTGFPTTHNVTYNCTELGTQIVELWVVDKAGNADFCETYVIVQDNMGNCPGSTPTIANVSGFVLTNDVIGVEDAEVNIKGSNPALPAPGLFGMTGAGGEFNFNALPVMPDYTLTAKKNTNPLNGVSTFDLVQMSKHILGVKKFDTPYKWIAGDINHNGQVTTFDIVELRKLILGVYTAFPANESWRFVDKNYQFTTNSPLQEAFPENVTVGNLNDFVAVKVGDLTGDALPNNAVVVDDRNPVGNLLFSVKDREIKAGEQVSVEFVASEKVAGYQFTLNFTGLEFDNLLPAEGMSLENFNTSAAAEGLISTSFNGDLAGRFTVNFRAIADGKLSKMLTPGSRLTNAEAYNLAGENLEVAFRFDNEDGTSTVATAGFELYQNEPNPVENTTAIRFHLPAASTATLTISDVSGKVLKTVRGEFAKGFHTINIERSDLHATGVLFYQLETPSASATKRMIALD